MPVKSEKARLLSAVRFAAEKHRKQRRKDDESSPYINHPIGVAWELATVGGVEDVEVLAAAVLHDTLEDTETSPEELEAVFGARVRSIVEEVTDDKSLPKAERKRLQVEHAASLSREAKLVKIGDKINNMGDVISHPPTDWSSKRRQEYLEWTEQVVAHCRGVCPELDQHYNELLQEGRKILSGNRRNLG